MTPPYRSNSKTVKRSLFRISNNPSFNFVPPQICAECGRDPEKAVQTRNVHVGKAVDEKTSSFVPVFYFSTVGHARQEDAPLETFPIENHGLNLTNSFASKSSWARSAIKAGAS